eukprot:TRINITY_DN58040_c0_g2_i1.p2 TRINITY_DN58040_c0_g2~~TRINITY_DN58040_c0_g2_i1.p2  ORF type:complete len:105 (+),score=12.90 TRINITY_DN58040_c0_g2_i1:44-316(+)
MSNFGAAADECLPRDLPKQTVDPTCPPKEAVPGCPFVLTVTPKWKCREWQFENWTTPKVVEDCGAWSHSGNTGGKPAPRSFGGGGYGGYP